MRKLFEIGGLVAAVVLIAFGAGAIVMGVQGGNTVKNSLKPRADHGLAGHDPDRDQGRGSEGRPRCERDHLPDEVCRRPRDQQRATVPALRRLHADPHARGDGRRPVCPHAALRNEGRQGHERSGSGPAGERPAGRQRHPRHLGDRDRTDHRAQHVATWRRGWPSSESSPESRSCSPASASASWRSPAHSAAPRRR